MHIPENGFYYHYKHDPAGAVNNYAYEVMGIGHHTEVDGLDESAMVMYRPLYEASVYKIEKHWDLRPVGMFMEDVTKDGKTFPRFQEITDEAVLAELAKVRDAMYT
jgi:hypothetical protein